jgi:transposase
MLIESHLSADAKESIVTKRFAFGERRDTEAGVACFSQLFEERIKSVQAIAMDLNSAHVKDAKQCMPLAVERIVHDPLHVMRMSEEALNKVRKQKHYRPPTPRILRMIHYCKAV